MTRKIKSVDDLPGWFHLNKYMGIRDMSNAQLAAELDYRLEMSRMDASLRRAEFRRLAILSFLVTKPGDRARAYSDELEIPGPEAGLKKRLGKNSYGLYDYDCQKVVCAEKMAKVEAQEIGCDSTLKDYHSLIAEPARFHHIKEKFEKSGVEAEFSLDYGMSKLCIDDLLNDDADDNYGVIKINFSSSEGEILDAIKELIPVYRDHYQVTSPSIKFTDKSIARIKSMKVIPYLDLSLWAEMEGVEIVGRVYADILYPNLEDWDKKKVYGTLKPMAARVMERQFIDTLWNVGMKESEKATREKIRRIQRKISDTQARDQS
ncbi:DUF6387 family protein [Endozoicomonas sp.]|uniref:DUF6387 family protein n=1 Tax=Endozoicomonas sp. TaxID=1892382 RepID=UPI003AF4E77B